MIGRVFAGTGCLAMGVALGLGLAASTGPASEEAPGATSGAGASVAAASATTLPMTDAAVVTPTACGSGPTVTATGSGMANGTPNLLTMRIGVQTTANSASAALSKNNSEAQTLVTTLEHGGVKASDIQTSNLSINPTYAGGNNPKVTGYQVEDDVTVQVHQLSSAGSLIDAAAAKLGNDVRFNGLSFSVSDPSGPSAAARAAALHVAVIEAQAMAKAAGSSLGALCSISDNGSSQPQPILEGNSGISASAGSLQAAPIQAGTQQFSAQVTVTYRLG